MTITVLTSASGSPGVTTTALGLTLQWPESCLLVDADYQRAILTGHLEGKRLTPNGLLNVINAARMDSGVREAVWRQSIPLPEDNPDGRRRLLLPGLTSPHTATALTESWQAIARALLDVDRTGIDIVVDLGRLTSPAGIHPALLEAASHVLLMTTPTLRAIGASHWAAQRLADEAVEYATSARVGVLLVRRPLISPSARKRGDPTPRGFDNHEIEEFLPLKVLGTITHDPVNASLLSDGGDRGAKFTSSGYASSLLDLAQVLARPSGQGRRSRHAAAAAPIGAGTGPAAEHADDEPAETTARIPYLTYFSRRRAR